MSLAGVHCLPAGIPAATWAHLCFFLCIKSLLCHSAHPVLCNSLMGMASPCRCVQDLPDACAENTSDCWKGDHKVNGQTMTFDACTDNIQTAKVSLLAILGKRRPGSALRCMPQAFPFVCTPE